MSRSGEMIMDKCNTIRVWFCPEWKSWAITWEDAEGNQLDDSEWFYTKAEAVDMARAYRDSDRCERLQIGTRG